MSENEASATQGAQHQPTTDFGSYFADASLEPRTFPVYGCLLCDIEGVLSYMRGHIERDHAYAITTESMRRAADLNRKESEGTAFVQREGDLEQYAALPVVDDTYGEDVADDLFSVRVPQPASASAAEVLYSCDRCTTPALNLEAMRAHVHADHADDVKQAQAAREVLGAPVHVGSTRAPLFIVGEVDEVLFLTIGTSPNSINTFLCRWCSHREHVQGAQVAAAFERLVSHVGDEHAREYLDTHQDFAERLAQLRNAEREALLAVPPFASPETSDGRDWRLVNVWHATADAMKADQRARNARGTGDDVPVKRVMLEVGVEGDKFNPHDENDECARAGCVELPQGWKPWTRQPLEVDRLAFLLDDVPYGALDLDEKLKAYTIPPNTSGYRCNACGACGSLSYVRGHVAGECVELLEVAHGGHFLDEFLQRIGTAVKTGEALYWCKPCRDNTSEVADTRLLTLEAGRAHILHKHIPARSPDRDFYSDERDKRLVFNVGSATYRCDICGVHTFLLGTLAEAREHVDECKGAFETVSPRLNFHPAQERVLNEAVADAFDRNNIAPADVKRLLAKAPAGRVLTPHGERRASELSFDSSTCTLKVKHAKCGELFDSNDEAMNHECVAEVLPASDDLVLLRGHLVADAADRRKERGRIREHVAAIGASLTHLREHLDDAFAELASVTEEVNEFEQHQHDIERQRSKRGATNEDR